jgi:predicted nucleic acid-binding protein
VKILIDASALVKALLREEGCEQAVAMWDEADAVFASRLLYPEARAAVARAVRARRIPAREARSFVGDLDDRWLEIDVVELTHRVATVAGDVAERHALRAGDAVHLASALVLDDPELTLATWDRRLGTAAVAAGVPVAPAV